MLGEYHLKYQEFEFIDLIFKGSFEYISEGRVYSEENFVLLQNLKNNSLCYESELLTRLDNGELLKVELMYIVNKELVPTKVILERTVGDQKIEERYILGNSRDMITYQFLLNRYEKEFKIQVPPKFQISVPNIVTSFIFISSKKYDSTSKNYHNILASNNNWDFQTPPKMYGIFINRPSPLPKKIVINGVNLKAMCYQVYSIEGFKHEKDYNSNEPPVEVFMSRHYSIPYRVKYLDDTNIVIKRLKEIAPLKEAFRQLKDKKKNS